MTDASHPSDPNTWDEVDLDTIDIDLINPHASDEPEPMPEGIDEDAYQDAEDRPNSEPAEQQQNPEPEDGKHAS